MNFIIPKSHFLVFVILFFLGFGSGNSLQGYSHNYPQQLNYRQYQNFVTDLISKTAISKKSSRIIGADSLNSKFLGAVQQENQPKTLYHIRRKRRRFNRPCYSRNSASTPMQQGRFLFDLNVYNIYDTPQSTNCGTTGNGLFDEISPVRRPLDFFQSFLSLFAPGIIQNAQAPPQFGDPIQANDQLLAGTDDAAGVDGSFIQSPPTTTRPVSVLFDSPGAAPLTPSQLVGGVATTVNGIIQQITGNSRPVYQGSYRLRRAYPNHY